MISILNQNWRIILPTVVLAFYGSACAKQCREARESILEPTDRVVQYLTTRPSGEELANAGCTLILSEFERLPVGAATIKRIADERFSHTESRCIRWERADRYVCRYYGGPYSRYRRCRWEPYSYCAAYDTDLIEEPGYREAVELSRNLDLTFERAQKLCRLAETGDLGGAEFASRDLLSFLSSEVRPESDRVYSMACGAGANNPGSGDGWDD